MLGTLRLGFADSDLSLVDLAQAEEHFLLAARYATVDYPEDSARAFLSAAWAAYCQGELADALAHTEEVMKLNPGLGEAIFLEAKFLMASEEPGEAILSLHKVIYVDRRYLLKAAGDGDFQRYDRELSDLIGSLREEARVVAETAIKSAESAINEMENWSADVEASVQYNSAIASLADAQDSYQTESYFGYLDAQSTAKEADVSAREAIGIRKACVKKQIEKIRIRTEGIQDDLKERDGERYASSEIANVRRFSRIAENAAGTETPENYKEALDLQIEALRIGHEAAGISIYSSSKRDQEKDRMLSRLPLVGGIVLGAVLYWAWLYINSSDDALYAKVFAYLVVSVLGLGAAAIMLAGVVGVWPFMSRGEREKCERLLLELKERYPDSYVPLLNAQVSSLRFFETGPDFTPSEERIYTDRFERATTRRVRFELALVHPRPGRKVDFVIKSVFHGVYGGVSGEESVESYIKPDWHWSLHYHSRGWDDPGKWSTGKYKVNIFIDGQPVDNGEFEVV